MAEVAPFYDEARRLYRRLLDAGLFDEANVDAYLPDEMLTCDEACRMIALVVMLSLQAFPNLKDEEVLAQAMREAQLLSASPDAKH